MRPTEITTPKPLPTFVAPPQCDPDGLVPEMEELKAANAENILTLRERTQAALSKNPSEITRNTYFYRNEITVLRNYGNALQECACRNELNRTLDQNNRSAFSFMILQHAMKLLATKGNDQPIHIASIGSGALLNEIFLLALLIRSGINNIQLDIVDLYYRDPEQEKINSLHTPDNLKRLLTEFFVLVHFGLGLTIVREPEIKNTTCSTLNGELLALIEKKTVLTGNPHLQAGQLRLGIFGSADHYADHLAEKQHSPDMIYDIDIEPVENRSEIMASVKSAAQDGSCWFALIKTNQEVIITREEKKESSWTSQSTAP